MVVSCKDEGVWGGHLEPESEVLYLAEVAILKCNDLKVQRTPDPEFGTKILGPKG